MMHTQKLSAIAAVIAAPIVFFGLQAAAHDSAHFSAGEPGDPKKTARVIMVVMRESDNGAMIYEPSKVVVKRGEQVRFILKNAGQIPHEFVLANREDNDKHAALMRKYPDMEHDDPNGKTLQPDETAEMVWRFTKAGEFEFACLIPGHRESGMLGIVAVK